MIINQLVVFGTLMKTVTYGLCVFEIFYFIDLLGVVKSLF